MTLLPQFLTRLVRPFTSAAMAATPVTIPEGAERATVAAGCFWGVEHLYRKHFGDKGLYDARVGYIGGDTSDPSYKAVCSGNTGRTSPLTFKLNGKRGKC
jgi:peptide-methionine (S)-S-oxide reductase